MRHLRAHSGCCSSSYRLFSSLLTITCWLGSPGGRISREHTTGVLGAVDVLRRQWLHSRILARAVDRGGHILTQSDAVHPVSACGRNAALVRKVFRQPRIYEQLMAFVQNSCGGRRAVLAHWGLRRPRPGPWPVARRALSCCPVPRAVDVAGNSDWPRLVSALADIRCRAPPPCSPP